MSFASEDTYICERLVVGLQDVVLKEKLMRKEDLTLHKALKMSQTQAQSDVKTLEPGSAETVNQVQAKHPSHDDNRRGGDSSPQGQDFHGVRHCRIEEGMQQDKDGGGMAVEVEAEVVQRNLTVINVLLNIAGTSVQQSDIVVPDVEGMHILKKCTIHV